MQHVQHDVVRHVERGLECRPVLLDRLGNLRCHLLQVLGSWHVYVTIVVRLGREEGRGEEGRGEGGGARWLVVGSIVCLFWVFLWSFWYVLGGLRGGGGVLGSLLVVNRNVEFNLWMHFFCLNDINDSVSMINGFFVSMILSQTNGTVIPKTMIERSFCRDIVSMTLIYAF